MLTAMNLRKTFPSLSLFKADLSFSGEAHICQSNRRVLRSSDLRVLVNFACLDAAGNIGLLPVQSTIFNTNG